MAVSTVLALAISAAGVGVALGTLVKAYFEYAQQGKQRRAELFFSLRARLKADNLGRIAELVDLTESVDPAKAADSRRRLAEIPLRDKRDYVGLFEEVAVFMKKGQIEPELAHYMFGYYALLCRECNEFWTNINFAHDYWAIFHDFCRETKVFQDKLIEELAEEHGPGDTAYISDDGELTVGKSNS